MTKKHPKQYKQITNCLCGRPAFKKCAGGGGVCITCNDIEKRNHENLRRHKFAALAKVSESNENRVRYVEPYKVSSVMNCV